MVPPGTRIASYEVIAQLGAGGMGEAYRSRDPKLDRAVAIKIGACFGYDFLLTNTKGSTSPKAGESRRLVRIVAPMGARGIAAAMWSLF